MEEELLGGGEEGGGEGGEGEEGEGGEAVDPDECSCWWSAGRHAGFVIRASPNLAFTYDLTVVSLPIVCVRLSSVCCHLWS